MSTENATTKKHGANECDFWCGSLATRTVELVLRDFDPVQHRYCDVHAEQVLALTWHARGVRCVREAPQGEAAQ